MYNYLTDREYRSIKNSWYDNDWSMGSIVLEHYYAKKTELRYMRKHKMISRFKFHVLMNQTAHIFSKCIDCVEKLKNTRIESFDFAVSHLEECIMKLDLIGYTVKRNGYDEQ